MAENTLSLVVIDSEPEGWSVVCLRSVTMFSKRVCQQLLTWSSYRRLRYSTPGPGLSHRLSHDEGNEFPMEFLTQPGPEARLPPGIYTDYGDMDSNMKETFKKVVHNEYTVLWANGGKVLLQFISVIHAKNTRIAGNSAYLIITCIVLYITHILLYNIVTVILYCIVLCSPSHTC